MSRERWRRGDSDSQERSSFNWEAPALERGLTVEQARVLYQQACEQDKVSGRRAPYIYKELLDRAQPEEWYSSPGKVTRTMLMQAGFNPWRKRPNRISIYTGQPIAPGKVTLTSYLQPRAPSQMSEHPPASQLADAQNPLDEAWALVQRVLARPGPDPENGLPPNSNDPFQAREPLPEEYPQATEPASGQLGDWSISQEPSAVFGPMDTRDMAVPIQAAGLREMPEAPLRLQGHGGGAEMPEDVRAKMEATFNVDFSRVRIHEGAHVEAIGALAYTHGTNIHFAPGQYQPKSQRGQELLGHELTHVVQQSQGRVQATMQAEGVNINDDAALEREAAEMGARAAQKEGDREAPPGPIGIPVYDSDTQEAGQIQTLKSLHPLRQLQARVAPTTKGKGLGTHEHPALRREFDEHSARATKALPVMTAGYGVAATKLMQFSRRQRTAAEDPSQWNEFEVGDSLLSEPDMQLGEALAENRSLGFTSLLIVAMRERLGIRLTPPEINLQFVLALRAFQSGQSRPPERVTELARPRDAVEGDVSGGEDAASMPMPQGSGILDADTIRQMDLAHHTTWGARILRRGDTRAHHNRPPWTAMDDALRRRAIEAVSDALGADAIAVTEVPDERGHLRRTIQINVAAAINWQVWYRRSHALRPGLFGTIGTADLELMNVPIPTPAVTAGAPSEAHTGTEAEEGESEFDSNEEENEDAISDEKRTLLEGLREQLQQYLNRRRQAGRRVSSAAREQARRQVDEDYDVEAISNDIANVGVVGLNPRDVQRPSEVAWARELIKLIDEHLAPHRLPPDGVHRRTHGEIIAGRDRIEGEGYVMRRERLDMRARDTRIGEIINDGYNLRLLTNEERARHESVTTITARAVADLTALEQKLNRAHTELDTALRSEESIAALRLKLVAIIQQDWSVPRVMRHNGRWRPPTLPLTRADRIPQEPREIRALASTWRRALTQAIRETRTQSTQNHAYKNPANAVNDDAVLVDLHRTGIEVCWNPGGTLPVNQMHLDPVFAERMIQYLTDIRSLGVTKLFTAGFLRAPMSPSDTHPRGMAVDITGYCLTDGTEIRLRSGYPLQPGDPRWDDLRHGHSDWFDNSPGPNGRSHRQIMLALAVRLRNYFTTIIGPGHDQRHMNHFHVEISDTEGVAATIYAVADPSAMPSWARARIERGLATEEERAE